MRLVEWRVRGDYRLDLLEDTVDVWKDRVCACGVFSRNCHGGRYLTFTIYMLRSMYLRSGLAKNLTIRANQPTGAQPTSRLYGIFSWFVCNSYPCRSRRWCNVIAKLEVCTIVGTLVRISPFSREHDARAFTPILSSDAVSSVHLDWFV